MPVPEERKVELGKLCGASISRHGGGRGANIVKFSLTRQRDGERTEKEKLDGKCYKFSIGYQIKRYG